MKEIALIGFVQTLFYALLLLFKKEKKIHDLLLTVFLLFVGAELLYRYLLLLGYETSARWLVMFDITYWALFGPLTLFYILTATGKADRLRPAYLLHLVPLFISLLSVSGFLGQSVQARSFIDYYNTATGVTRAGLLVWEYASPLYLFYSLLLLRKHARLLKEQFSDISGRDIRWLMMLVAGFFTYCLLTYALWVTVDFFTLDIRVSPLNVLPAVLTVYVFFMGFYGFRQGPILPAADIAGVASKHHPNRKYCKSGLREQERKQLVTGLKTLMDDDKPYLDNDLTITDLAVRLNTNFHKLSQVINESLNQTFYDFVNTYRIEESKRLLQCPEAEKYTITAIAQDAGFTSKSAFYNAFRKQAGMTPGQYLERARINAS